MTKEEKVAQYPATTTPSITNGGRTFLSKDVMLTMRSSLFSRIMCMSGVLDAEVGGLGKLKSAHADKFDQRLWNLNLVDTWWQPCIATAGHYDMDTDANVKWFEENLGEGWRDARPRPSLFWWHSHVNMDVFFSASDEACIDAMCAIGGLVVSMVVNHRGEFKIRADMDVELEDGSRMRFTIPAKLTVDHELAESDMERILDEARTIVITPAEAEKRRAAAVAKQAAEVDPNSRLGRIVASATKPRFEHPKGKTTSWRDRAANDDETAEERAAGFYYDTNGGIIRSCTRCGVRFMPKTNELACSQCQIIAVVT